MAKKRHPTTPVNLRIRDDLLERMREVKRVTGKNITTQIHEACFALVTKQGANISKLAKLRAKLLAA